MKAKCIACLLAVAAASPVLAVEPAQTSAGEIQLVQPNLGSALRNLASIFGFSLEVRAALEGDEPVTLAYSRDVKAILANLLRNRDYVMRLSPEGKVESVVILNAKFGSVAAKDVAKIAPASAAEIAKQASGAF